MVLCYSVFQRHPSEVSEMCRKRWKPVFLCVVLIFKFTESTPIGHNQIIDFRDDWNYKTDPGDVPLLKEGMGKFLTAFYHYSEDLEISPSQVQYNTDERAYARSSKKMADVVRRSVPCGVCKLGVSLLHREVQQGSSFYEIRKKFVSLCVSFKIQTEPVCTGFFDVFGPEVLPALNVTKLGTSDICRMVLGESCDGTKTHIENWSIDLPEKRRVSRLPTNPTPGQPVFKILQISDPHLDPDYVAGSPANCEEPLCCREYSTPNSSKPTIPAGRWGTYGKCDAPSILLENMLEHIVLEHPDIDYVIWTGDLPPHDIWNQTKESSLAIIKHTVEQMLAYFPNTAVFPAVGNHESVPAGSFAPSWMKDAQHSIDWLYETLVDHWRKWLPSSIEDTVRHGGFYSVLLRPGFRLIGLNTNYCHVLSWWLLVNDTDPARELQWFVYQLQKAEDNNEKVHIIGHIAPGSPDCLETWSKNYYSIIERYADIITGMFYGHSHADEFEIFYETKEYSKELAMRWRAALYKNITLLQFTGNPINVAYLGPSVTTYENFNPAYRIYYVDGDHENTTREVIDHETWTMDLNKANEENNDPIWYKLYSAKDAYQMKSLRADQWNHLLQRMLKDSNLFDTFYKNYYRNSAATPDCDKLCKIQVLCDLKSGKSQSRKQLCSDLELA